MLAKVVIKLPDATTPAYIKDNPKFFPFLKDCIGAIDGSHYSCHPPKSSAETFRNRKGFLTTNVLVAVDFDGRFIYMLSGWEGSAHDWKVYRSAFEKGFYIPDGKYLLADAGYNDSHRLLTPFRAIRYHLQEYARHGLRPETSKELYNLRHSQARMVVERAIGRHKNTFRILTSRVSYPIEAQVKILYATAGLMNWIIDYGSRTTFLAGEMPVSSREEHSGTLAADLRRGYAPDELIAGEKGRMAVLRQRISFAMWEQYVAHMALRNLENGAEDADEPDGRS